MSTMPTFKSDNYDDGRTKQSFKDSTDINKILARAARGESISHLQRHGAAYGDFSDIDDLLDAHAKLARGREIFEELPSEVRREFDQDVSKFFKYVNDPRNKDQLHKVLPALAEPGTQLTRPGSLNTGSNAPDPAERPDAEASSESVPEGTPAS